MSCCKVPYRYSCRLLKKELYLLNIDSGYCVFPSVMGNHVAFGGFGTAAQGSEYEIAVQHTKNYDIKMQTYCFKIDSKLAFFISTFYGVFNTSIHTLIGIRGISNKYSLIQTSNAFWDCLCVPSWVYQRVWYELRSIIIDVRDCHLKRGRDLGTK